MRAFILLLIAFLVTYVSAIQLASVAGVQPGQYRQFTVAANPTFANASAWSMFGIGVNANGSANGGSVQVDAAALSFSNPNNNPASPSLGFYFGYFEAGATWAKSFGIAHGAAEAALAEVAAVFDSIFVYFNYDGQSGFQYTLGNNFWDCTAAQAAGYDCINTSLSLSLNSLSWNNLAYTNYSCPNAAGYASNCEVHTFTTTGSLNGFQVVTFVYKLANQPVFIDGVKVTGDYGKIDITINYPWAAQGVTQGSAKVGLFAYGAGKTAAAAAVAATVNGNSGFLFAASSTTKPAFFSWAGTATINNNGNNVYFEGLTGAQVSAYCTQVSTTCGLIEYAIFAAYRLAITIYTDLGWNVEFLWFSWDVNQPASIAWDPEMGVNDPTTASSAGVIYPTYFFVVAILLSLYKVFSH
jgi:hypothetical protein